MKIQSTFFSTKQYYKQSAIHFAFAVLTFFLCLCGGLIDENMAFGLGFGVIAGGIILVPAVYGLSCALRYDKAARSAEIFRGTVSNWTLGFTRGAARICVDHNGEEYTTSAYFAHEAAKALVGCEITFCILEDTVFILEIHAKNN